MTTPINRNQLWRTPNSRHKPKKIGDIESSSGYQNTESFGYVATIQVRTDEHYYSITLTEERLRGMLKMMDAVKACDAIERSNRGEK